MTEGGDYAAASTIGARERQEDDWGTHVNPPALEPGAWLLAVVADGMGGMPAGDRASSIALRAFLDSYAVLQLPAPERLRRALAHANREMAMAVEAEPELAGMGSTLVAALVFPDRCEWLSVGDSLLLRWREGDNATVIVVCCGAQGTDDSPGVGDGDSDEAREPPATAGDEEVEETVADAPVVPARRDPAAGLQSWQRVAGGFVVGLLAATAAWHLVEGF